MKVRGRTATLVLGGFLAGATLLVPLMATVQTASAAGVTISGKPPAGQVGNWYSTTFTATGGSGTYTWSDTGTLPPGTSLNTSTGTVSGTPTTAGSFSFTLRATSGSMFGTARETITIAPNPVFLEPQTMDTGCLYCYYDEDVFATGGTTPYSFALIGGSLPPGVSLNTSGGDLEGCATRVGTYSFKIEVTDANGATSTQAYTIKILAN